MYFGIPFIYVSVVWSSAEFSYYTSRNTILWLENMHTIHTTVQTPSALCEGKKKQRRKTKKSTKKFIHSFYDLPCCWSWWNKTASAQLSNLDLIWLGFSWKPMEWKYVFMLVSTLVLMEQNFFVPTKY